MYVFLSASCAVLLIYLLRLTDGCRLKISALDVLKLDHQPHLEQLT